MSILMPKSGVMFFAFIFDPVADNRDGPAIKYVGFFGPAALGGGDAELHQFEAGGIVSVGVDD